jgi:RNA polymerase sigma factor (sigma-70 family)
MMTSELTPMPGSTARMPERDARRERLAVLLEAAVAGRREALEGIVVELTPLLWHVARAQGLDRSSAEDVVQATWLTLWRQLGEIRSPAALTAWLVTVTRREALRLRRSDERVSVVETDVLESFADNTDGVDDRILVDERQAVLWRAVRALPARCRELIRIVAYTDRPSYETLARALGMPQGSIGPTRGRCLAKLRALLTSSSDWSWP